MRASSSISTQYSNKVTCGGSDDGSGDAAAHEDVEVIFFALFDAAACEELTKMITPLESQAFAAWRDLNSAQLNDDGETLLHVAVISGCRYILQCLLGCDGGVQVDARNSSGWTPLMTAIDVGDTRMARILIDYGADVNLLWIENYSCLGCAVVLSAQQPENPARLEMIRLLIASGADINTQHTATGQTPLQVAVMFECTAAMAILVESGADLSATDTNDYTVVDFAAANGMLSVLQWLEQQGMTEDFERESSEKRTPLSRAATGGFLDVVRFLVYSQNKRWRHTMTEAIVDAAVEESQDQVDPGFVGEDLCIHRSRALYWALQSGHYKIVVFLCENGARASRIGAGVGYNHTTALHIAAKYGRVDLADFLIETQGADVNYRNQRGRTPLHTAVIEGHIGMVELLLAHGADLESVSQSRISFMASKKADMKTPLQFAVWHEHYEVAAFLLHHGASTHVLIALAVDDVNTLMPSNYPMSQESDRVLALLTESPPVQVCAS